MNKIMMVAKKLALLTMTVLPLASLADLAPMSRDEWERHRQFIRAFAQPSFTGCVLACLIGLFLSVFVFALVKHRCDTWRNFLSKAPMEWVVFTILILASCLAAELAFSPCSTFLSIANIANEESYEEYLFYEKHCRTCGTALRYHQGRYCPKCNPRCVDHPAAINSRKTNEDAASGM